MFFFFFFVSVPASFSAILTVGFETALGFVARILAAERNITVPLRFRGLPLAIPGT